MKLNHLISGCACCPMNRRNFLTRASTATVGALGALAAPTWLNAAEPKEKTRIRIIYALHSEKQAGPDWPNKGFDFRPVMDRINNTLAEKCQGFEFVASLATGEEQAKKLIEQDKITGNIDGYLVYQMNCWNQVVQSVAASGKPVLYADFQFGGSGGFLVYTAGFLRSQAPNVGFVASSKMKDVVEAVKCFQAVKQGGTASDFAAATSQVRLKGTPRAGPLAGHADPVECLAPDECVRRLKEAKILAIRDQNSGPGSEMMGINIEQVPFAELNEAWQQADKDEALTVADRWTKEAKRIEGVTRETLETSAAM